MQTKTSDNRQPEDQKRTRAIIIANPTAGSYEQNRIQIEETVSFLNDHGWDAELKLTQGPGDGGKLTQEAVEQQYDAVIAVGGDGTINEIIQKLAGSETALGVLPSGTVNVWAREVGIPLENAGARDVLVNGQTRRIDLGQVNERYFLLMSTLGLDAEITHTVEKNPLKKWGILSYIFLGAWLGPGYPNFTVFIQKGEGERAIRARALQVIFGNTQLYAGTLKFTWRAKCDDGKLDLALIYSQNLFGRLRVLLDFLLRRKDRQRWVRYDSVVEVKIHTNAPVAIQVDGDPDGRTNKRGFPPTIIRVVPATLNVIVPQKLPEELFSQP
ncbi:MAG: diacylglycerol kinase family lipid kinase [Ktedonobacteraceae bacterium]